MSDLHVDEASVADAAAMCEVIHTAFSVRPIVEPATTAVDESVASVAAAIERHGGLLCRVRGIPAGALLFGDGGSGVRALRLRRVSVLPHLQCRGVGSALVELAEEVAARRGYDDVVLRVRSELPTAVTFWTRRGYVELGRGATYLTVAKALPVEVVTRSAEESRALGKRIAGLTRPGDVVILTGELGAGKTTLTQGIATGLDVRGEATSPTYVIARVHPALAGGPDLVHVDAYRLGDILELDDLDLDAGLDESVTVVEWGEGVAEGLSPDRLRVQIARLHGGADVISGQWHELEEGQADLRTICITPSGARWVGAGVRSHLAASARAATP